MTSSGDADASVVVFRTLLPTQADLIAGAMRSAGFEAHVLRFNQGERGPAEAHIVVRASDEGEAREFIQALDEERSG
jgi:hypothetical protein